jgi:peptidoglycan hydrolase-like protein with peptidoglycan-binding domain
VKQQPQRLIELARDADRRVVVGVGVLFAVIAICVVAVASGGGQAASDQQELSANTAKVEEGRLSDMVSQPGTLTFRARSDGSPYSVINQAEGTYTELPDPGERVDCGDVLYRVNKNPVLLLCGKVPAYRDLKHGQAGSDVRQLNRNLHRLGYDTEAGVEIDPDDYDFTVRTRAALEELQDHERFAVTGKFGVADAVFLPESARIAEVTALLGGAAQPGTQVMQATSDTPEVQVDLDPSQQKAVKRGDRAQVTLPNNRSVTGRVERLGRVTAAPADQDTGAASAAAAPAPAQDPGAGGATIRVYITLDHPDKARGLDEAPVQVQIATKGVANALSVPVTAIVGRSGDGFAVEVVRDDGQHELVTVKPGLFDTADGRVQVEGALRVGDDVVVPSL